MMILDNGLLFGGRPVCRAYTQPVMLIARFSGCLIEFILGCNCILKKRKYYDDDELMTAQIRSHIEYLT